ncbi:hypothetical protein SteCoe_30057 [Stentor coeruleus]|uniref:Uncharacterized protein n=1 Tax=Stentor coeruleus TaxID=5963 RepID=A0A1R2B4E1_9CILI|nr:hypothetical protein SteCoe_30057 [Stentor coeruleus]
MYENLTTGGKGYTESGDVRVRAKIEGKSLTLKKCRYARYNHVIKQYNKECNRIQDIYLNEIPSWWFMDLRKTWTICLSLLLCLIFSPIMLFFTICRLISLIKAKYVVEENISKISQDPFKNMIYHRDLQGRINEYFTLTNEKLMQTFYSFQYVDEIMAEITKRFEFRLSKGETITIMLYTKTFEDNWKNVLDNYSMSICLTCFMIGLCLVSLSVVVVVVLLI